MERHEDARLRLAAFRHPAARAVGSLPLAQRRLDEAARAFVTVMSAAGDPGAEALPPPAGRAGWPPGHGAHHVRGWPLEVPGEPGARCWIDTDGRWWLLRLGAGDRPADAHVVGSPLRAAAELADFREALDGILTARRVRR